MAYRDPTFNANLLTDLLGTYLTHNSQEREKYYKAEQQGNRPQYRTVDGNLVSIERDGQITTLMTKKVQEKEPKFEDFSKDGNVNKGQFMGQNYISTEKDKNAGMPKGYKFVSSRPLFKPEDPDKEAKSMEKENRSFARKRIERLLRIKNRTPNFNEQMLIRSGLSFPSWNEELNKELKFYQKILGSNKYNIYGVEQSAPTSEEVKIPKQNDPTNEPMKIIGNMSLPNNSKKINFFKDYNN
jgi:hypothetical protein